MFQKQSNHLRLAWFRVARCSTLLRMSRAWLAILVLVMFLPGAANAACGTLNLPDASTSPATSPMASGGTIDVTTSCDPFGLGLYPDTQLPGLSSPPSHGSVTIVNRAGGIFSYTNNGDGATSDSFVLTDASNNEFTVNVAIAAPASAIVISPNALSGMQAGAPFSQSLSATGGTAPYAFTVDSGSPPPGLSLSGNTISGTPTQRGTYSFSVKATDDTGATQVKSYTGTVTNPNLTLSPTSSQGSIDTPFSVTYTPAGGVAPYTGSLAPPPDDQLPPGLTLNGLTLSGTPTALGTYSFKIVVQDSSTGPGDYFQFMPVTVTIVPAPPTISTVAPSSGVETGGTGVTINGTGFTGATAVTFGGSPATSITVVNDTTITATTPAHAAGAVAVAVTAPGGNVSKPNGFIYLPVAPVAGPASATVGFGSANNPIMLNISGGTPASVAVPILPANGSVSVSGTSITYTPTAGYAGPDSFTYTATNAGGTSAPATVTITVSPPNITYTPANPPVGTVGVAYSQSIAGASGGTAPYTYRLVSGSLPANVTLNANGTLTGTPIAAGTFNFTVRAADSSTGPGAPFISAPANVSVTINAAAPTISSVTPAIGSTFGGTAVTIAGSGFTGATAVTFDGVAATAITVVNDTTITATTPAHAAGAVAVAVMTPGGNASLPNGFTYAAPGPTISSVAPNIGPATGGTVVTITGTGFTGATAVTIGGTAATGITIVNDTTISATTPAHAAGAVAVAVVTPGGNASLPNGFTYAAPVPTIASVAPATGSTVGGTSVTITGTGFTGATAMTFGGTPATSFTVNNDTSITATTPAHAAGAVAIAVTTPGGNASLPSGFTYAAPIPTVASHTHELQAGTSATVDLTQGATGGPFTAAAIVTPPPASDGTASIVHNGAQWQLVYASTVGAASTVVVRYTLSNASGTSEPGTVTFTVIARPDPSRDPEVIGLLNAQAQSAQRFAKSQITNFRDRLEQLHDDSSREATSMNVRLGIPQDPNDPNALGYSQENRPYDPTRSAFAYTPDDAANSRKFSGNTPPPKNGSPSALAFWAGGFVNFGTANKHEIDLEHTLIGVSGGVDYRFSPNFTAGIGFGYGRDTVDVGTNGTQSKGEAFSTAIYGSYHPHNNVFVDGLLGYSALDFGSKRFVTPTSDFANGDRSGSQVFGSLSGGYEYKSDQFLLSPYGRIEAAWTRLNGFTESGAASYDLTFGDQEMNMFAGVLGMRTEYAFPQDWGLLKARGRLEYTHDFSGSSWASMGYADLNIGLPYTLDVDAFSRDYLAAGLGFDASIDNGATIGFDYTTAFGFDGNSQAHNFALRFGARF
ncbi:MAG: IPT/TIG domain-containing protein [Phyllobacterium sp.]